MQQKGGVPGQRVHVGACPFIFFFAFHLLLFVAVIRFLPHTKKKKKKKKHFVIYIRFHEKKRAAVFGQVRSDTSLASSQKLSRS